MADKRLLPPKTGDLSDWYTTLIRLADLADYGPAKGSMIFKPYGYALWERLQTDLDHRIKAAGVDNAYFPLLIPMSFLEREQHHVEGFAPELAVVTHGGGEPLEEALAVRPTSETIMYDAFGKWVQSWRDLPIKVNQWCNVLRWEKRTMPFLRTSEFLWQEGHTAHATHDEALEMQRWAIDTYAAVYREVMALPGYVGYKSQSERFAGADTTLTIEMLMPSGKALQSCTSHDLGQNFSKVFGIDFQDQSGGVSYAWQTSWGLSTRSIGGLILFHGDNNGLVLPPKLAPIEVVIVPVKPEPEVLTYVDKLASRLREAGRRVVVDARDDETFGFKLNKWEVKGVPLTLKIGAKEASANSATVKRRIDGSEVQVAFEDVTHDVATQLDTIQQQMLQNAEQHLAAETRTAATYDEFKALLEKHKGFIKVAWNDDPAIEAKIKEETKATSRCRPLDWPEEDGLTDFVTGKPARQWWLFAQSY